MKKVGTALKQFFVSLGEDFKNLFTKHFWKFIGYVIMFIVPIVVLVCDYIKATPAKSAGWTIPVFVIIPLVILLLVYWCKAKRHFAIKLSQMKTENEVQKGKHAGAIIVFTTIEMLSTVLPFAICYILFKGLAGVIKNVEDIFLFITICEAVGGLFVIIDATKNCIDYAETEEESNEN